MPEARRSQGTDLGNTQLGLFATHDTLPSPGPADPSGDSPLRECGGPTGPGPPGSATPRRESDVPGGAADAEPDSSEELGGSGRRDASPLLAPSTEGDHRGLRILAIIRDPPRLMQATRRSLPTPA